MKGNRLIRSFLFAGLLLIGLPFATKAQTGAPTFVNGSNTSITVCQNAVAEDFSFKLDAIDPDGSLAGILNWTVVSGPLHGTFSGVTSGSSVAQPGPTSTTGWTYTPTSGYTGGDMFVIRVDDGPLDGSSTIMVNVIVSALPSFTITSIPAVCAGTTSTTLSYSSLSGVGPTTSTFVYTGGAQSWIAPPNVTSATFDVQGAVGGNDNHSSSPNPGNGGRVTGNLTFPLNAMLDIYVGGAGANGSISGAAGGWNGGGNAFFYFFGCGGAGGGASDIRMGGNALTNRVVVAGGGGGNGWDAPGPAAGGAGGGLIGGSSANNVGGSHSGGGTQLTGGAAAFYTGWTSGGNGSLGMGGNGSVQGISGGGGGGYFGGGGGIWTGGGGGSSFTNAGVTSSVIHTQGYNIGNGIVSLSYDIPGTYTITWDAGAYVEGFADVIDAPMPASPVTIAVPGAGTPGTYTGYFSFKNSSCTSITYPISITINPIPDVTMPANQVLCNNEYTASEFFNGAVAGTTFDWVNDNSSIGLAASGTGNIPSFQALNPVSAFPVIATITVTPSANGCVGTPVSYTITVNPAPKLITTFTSPICDSTIFDFPAASATPGTSLIWTVNPTSGIIFPFSSGSGNPSAVGEYLDNTTSSDVTVTFKYLLAANGCVDSVPVNVTVHPTPMLNSPLTATPICSGNTFNYTPSFATTGSSYVWNRNTIAGISQPSATNNIPINEVLTNTTSAPITVSYDFTIIANTCVYHQTVTVIVNPTPMLNSGLTPPAICNNTLFSYGPGSATTGTSFVWNRSATAGITPAINNGVDSINETLSNSLPNPVTVNYAYTLTANGCSNVQNVSVIVYPKPMLSSNTAPAICDSTVFNYPPASLTAGTTYTWTRAVVAGISNLAGAGTGNPNETLKNTTTHDVLVTYIYSLMANGCTNTQNVVLTVHPTPTLSSSLTPPTICDSSMFSYSPASNTAGAAFTWYRPYIPGIYAVSATGAGNPNQKLINSTYVVVDVMYVYTVTANGCSNVQNVVVKVNPTPKLNPPFTGAVCSGSPFNYVPTSYTPGAGYAWNRPQVTNIGATTNFGTGAISETLTNSVLTPVVVEYVYRLSIGTCTNLYTQSVKVTVNPTPAVPQFTTYPPATVCLGTQFQNFGTSVPFSSVLYTWSATNADVYATGSNNQYAIVSFNRPGVATITLTSNVNGFGCKISNSYTVTVSDAVAPKIEVTYFNNQFICLKNDVGFYQWGYDDARTLDSTILTGEIDQNYNNSNPDFTNRRYWVITSNGGCSQKAYYNKPTGITEINNEGGMKVYPNPSSATINVEISAAVSGDEQVEIINMLGQKVASQTASNHKASFNVAELPSGVYLVDCFRDGVKVATTRFIKN